MVYNLKYMVLMSYMTATYSNYFQNLQKERKTTLNKFWVKGRIWFKILLSNSDLAISLQTYEKQYLPLMVACLQLAVVYKNVKLEKKGNEKEQLTGQNRSQKIDKGTTLANQNKNNITAKSPVREKRGYL